MLSDDEIIREFKRNEDFLRAYIRKFIPSRSRSLVDSDDILQETIAEALANAPKFRSSSLGTWMKTTAKRKLIDCLRRANAQRRGGGMRRRTLKLSNRSSAAGISLPSRGRSPSSLAGRVEADALVRRSIARLPDRQRQSIELRFLQGKSIREVAEAMRLSEPAAKMLLQRSLQGMRTALHINPARPR